MTKIGVKKIVVAAAGKGTRLLPITSVLPKEILPIVDKPVIQYVLEEGIVDGIEELVLVISKKKELLLNYLENTTSGELKDLIKNVKITIVYQQEGGKYGDAVPIMAAADHLKDEPFLVAWSDSFSLRQDGRIRELLATYQTYQKPVISLIPISERETSLYAVPEIKNIKKSVGEVKRLLEKPGPERAPSLVGAPNGFVLEPEIFLYLNNLTPNKKGEYSLIDAIDVYCQEKMVYGRIFKGPFFEAGNKADVIATVSRIAEYRDDLKELQQKYAR